jgi:membrane associated rhomboid family serine protease
MFLCSFLAICCFSFVVIFVLVFYFSRLYGQSNVLIYTAICSLMGSLSVMSCLPVVPVFSIGRPDYIVEK